MLPCLIILFSDKGNNRKQSFFHLLGYVDCIPLQKGKFSR